MKLTILRRKKFRATHPTLGTINGKIIMLDYDTPVLSKKRVIIGYMIAKKHDPKPFIFSIDMVCEALENGFCSQGLTTLELIN